MIIASIDIGTNTVLLLIARITNKGEIETVLNEFRIPRIGRGLLPGYPVSDENLNQLFEVLKDYESIILKNNCNKVIVTATHALRIASNSDEIIKRISEKFNWKVDLISGEEEAIYAFAGAVNNKNPHTEYLVIDIGGGSTEIIIGRNTGISYRKSFKIGVVSGTENFLFKNPPPNTDIAKFNEYLNEIFKDLTGLSSAPDTAIALAGTPTTLSCMKQNLEEYNEQSVEGSKLAASEIELLIGEISKITVQELKRKYKSVMNGREDIILAGAIILFNIMKLLNLSEVIVSTKGIRYGAISVDISK